jgi:hypothetical protein
MYDFPRYRSHKVVGAAQIIEINAAFIMVHAPGDGEHPERSWAIPHAVELSARYAPKVGDYLVQYEDGYLSISPKAAFEGGYSAIGEV